MQLIDSVEENFYDGQFFFSAETLLFFSQLSTCYGAVLGLFTPSLLTLPNVTVIDRDPRFAGHPRFRQLDLATSPIPLGLAEIPTFDLVVADPPFFEMPEGAVRALVAAVSQTSTMIALSDYCWDRTVWGEAMRECGFQRYFGFIPTYRSIANGYCEMTLKEKGRTNIALYVNFDVPANVRVMFTTGDRSHLPHFLVHDPVTYAVIGTLGRTK